MGKGRSPWDVKSAARRSRPRIFRPGSMDSAASATATAGHAGNGGPRPPRRHPRLRRGHSGTAGGRGRRHGARGWRRSRNRQVPRRRARGQGRGTPATAGRPRDGLLRTDRLAGPLGLFRGHHDVAGLAIPVVRIVVPAGATVVVHGARRAARAATAVAVGGAAGSEGGQARGRCREAEGASGSAHFSCSRRHRLPTPSVPAARRRDPG